MGIDYLSAMLNAYETIISFINTLVTIVQWVIAYWGVLAPLFE